MGFIRPKYAYIATDGGMRVHTRPMWDEAFYEAKWRAHLERRGLEVVPDEPKEEDEPPLLAAINKATSKKR
jgi:hypothetical protein